MDPLSLIMAALAAGAIAGAQSTAGEVIRDAYGGLKALLGARLRGRPAGEMALERHEAKPEQWGGALEAELVEAGVDQDPEVVRAAQGVMDLVDPQGAQSGKYVVQVRGAQGLQVGDGNVQTNTWSSGGDVTR